jgi:hypothetical protein
VKISYFIQPHIPFIGEFGEDRLDANLDGSRHSAGPNRDVTRQEITNGQVEDRLENLGYLD